VKGLRLKSTYCAGRSFPLRHCADTIEVNGKGGVLLVWWDEVISDRRKDRDETLQSAGGSKALHHPLSFSHRQMRIFRAIVQAFVRSMFNGWHHVPPCRSI